VAGSGEVGEGIRWPTMDFKALILGNRRGNMGGRGVDGAALVSGG
jgi:hypothetical protein